MKKPRSYLELGKRKRLGRPDRPRGPIPPTPDPATTDDLDLGTWRVQPSALQLVRADRIVSLDVQAMTALLIIAQAAAEGINRDVLTLMLFGPAGSETHPAKLRRVLSLLRRVCTDDGSVRLENTPGDGYAFVTGEPQRDGPAPSSEDSTPLMVQPKAVQSWLRRGRRRGLAIGIALGVVVVLSISLVLMIDRRQGVLYGQVVKVVPLAAEPGQATSPSFSQDGRRIVYAWRKPDGTQKLYVRSVTGGDAHALTSGSGTDANPVWSPTGGLVGFQRRSTDGCAVMVVPADGGEARTVGDCNFGAAGPMTWLRDGTALTFMHRGAWSMPGQIVSVNVHDGRMIGITNPTSGMPGDSQPSLASTGRRLAFVRTRAVGAEDVQLLELGGTAPERVTHDLAPIAGTAWEPAGRAIVYASARRGQDALYRARMDGAPTVRLVGGVDPIRHPALTTDGRFLAYEHWHLTTSFLGVGASADDVATNYRTGVALERGLTLSADGRRLAYVSNLGGHDAVYVADAPAGLPKPVTRKTYDSIETPRWAPDGRSIAYTAVTNGHWAVYQLDLTGGEERPIATEGENRAPAYSHDGRFIYFGSTRNAGHWQIFRQSLTDGAAVQLTTEGGLAAYESPDGDLLYFVRADRRGLWRRPSSPGGDDLLIAPDLVPLDWRNVTVAADAIWYVSRPAGDAVLSRYVFARGRSEPGAVIPGLLVDSGLALLADGKHVALSATAEAQVDIELATLE